MSRTVLTPQAPTGWLLIKVNALVICHGSISAMWCVQHFAGYEGGTGASCWEPEICSFFLKKNLGCAGSLLWCAGSSLLHAGFLQLQRAGSTFYLQWLLSLRNTGSETHGFSSCRILGACWPWWCAEFTGEGLGTELLALERSGKLGGSHYSRYEGRPCPYMVITEPQPAWIFPSSSFSPFLALQHELMPEITSLMVQSPGLCSGCEGQLAGVSGIKWADLCCWSSFH